MKASHFVIEDILKEIEDDMEGVCEKFEHRYPDDKELVDILSAKEKNLKKIKDSLRKLANKRKFTENSGGTGLWMPDRRKGSTETKLR